MKKYFFIAFALAFVTLGYFLAPNAKAADFLVNATDTMGIYQLDSTSTDELGIYNPTQGGNALPYASSALTGFGDYGVFSLSGDTWLENVAPADPTDSKTWTVGMLFKSATSQNNRFLYVRNTNGTPVDGGIHIQMNSGHPVCYVQTVASTDVTLTASSTYNDDNWHSLICTSNPTTMNLYVDGYLVATGTTPAAGIGIFSTSTGVARIGEYNYGTSFGFQGGIDNVFILNTELSQAFAAQIWSGGLVKKVTTIPSDLERMTWAMPTNNQTLKETDLHKYFHFTISNFKATTTEGAAKYIARAYYSLATTTSNIYPALLDENLSWSLTDNTAQIHITNPLFLPAYGTSTPWKANVYLYSIGANGNYTLIQILPEIKFNITLGIPTSTDRTANHSEWINGRLVDNAGYLINESGEYVDITGVPTTTRVKAPTYQEEISNQNATGTPFFVDCSMFDNTTFFSSSSIDKIYCNAKKLTWGGIGLLVMPPDWATHYVTSSLEEFKDTPPFSFVFNFKDILQNQLAVSASSTGENVVIPIPGHGSFTILATNTVELAAGSDLKNQVFEAIKNILWLGTAITAILMI